MSGSASLPGVPLFVRYDVRVAQPIPTVDAGSNVTLQGTIGQRPDGKHVCILIFSTDHNSYQQAIPPDAAENMGATLGPMLIELAAQARRADSGLIIASGVPTQPNNGGNKK